MKKSLFTLVLGLLISVAAMAQSKNDRRAETIIQKEITKIEASLTLEDEEKETFKKIKKEQVLKHIEIVEEFKTKDPVLFKQKVRENNQSYNKSMFEAFGKPRAREIFAAIKK